MAWKTSSASVRRARTARQAKVFDVVLATSAYSESSYAKTQNGYDKDVTYPSEALCGALRKSAARLGMPLIEGAVHSSDVFYRDAEPVIGKSCGTKRAVLP